MEIAADASTSTVPSRQRSVFYLIGKRICTCSEDVESNLLLCRCHILLLLSGCIVFRAFVKLLVIEDAAEHLFASLALLYLSLYAMPHSCFTIHRANEQLHADDRDLQCA